MSNEYHKIQTVFQRDEKTKRIIEGAYTLPEFGWLANNVWEWSEKVDGTCVRVWAEDGRVRYGGKTEAASLHVGLLNHLRDTFDRRAENLAKLVLYGEGFGEKIQGGGKYTKGYGFVLFDVQGWDYGLGRYIWLRRDAVENIGANLEIPVAPIIGTGTLHEMVEFARAGFNSTWGDFQAEGIVARPAAELMTRRGERIITKIKTNDFKHTGKREGQ